MMNSIGDVSLPNLVLIFAFCLISCNRDNTNSSQSKCGCEYITKNCSELTELVSPNLCSKTNLYFNFECALNIAKAKSKPLLVYFNAVACVNCRKFEEEVGFHPKTIDYLSDNFILTMLYTDVQCPLPKNKMKISELTGRKIKTVGAYNSELQVRLTQSGHHPYLAIVDTNQKLISKYSGELNSKEEFQSWILSSLY